MSLFQTVFHRGSPQTFVSSPSSKQQKIPGASPPRRRCQAAAAAAVVFGSVLTMMDRQQRGLSRPFSRSPMIKLGERYGWICGHSSVCHSLKTQYLGQHQWDFTGAFFCHFQKFYRLAQKKCIITRCCLRWSLLSVSLCPSSPAATRGNTLSAPCHIYRSASFAGRRVFCCLCLFLCAFFFSPQTSCSLRLLPQVCPPCKSPADNHCFQKY